jgi:hypothetical protein
MRSIPCALWGALLFALCAAGQDKTSPNLKSDPNSVEVRFADDSIVKMVLQQSTIDVVTRYGKLTLPLDEIRRIDFGLRIPEDTAKRIDLAIARLGSPDFKQRESASAELLDLRELAYPALTRAAQSSEAEVARRAKDTIKTLIETVPAERLHAPRQDTIVTSEFTFVGKVEATSLKARTPYFGEANVKLAEMRSMRWLSSGRETRLSVDAAKHGAQQEAWLDSGVEVRAGMMLQVAASGRVDLNPALGEAGTNMVGPDGLLSRGRGDFAAARGGFGPMGPGGGGPGGPGGGRGGGRAAMVASMGVQSPGALIGRIGEHGRVFVLGSRFEGAAPEDGKFYLRIVPSSAGVDSSGSYDVRVTAGR